MKTIIIKDKLYNYAPVDFYYRRKLIDKKISKNNLLDFKTIMDTYELSFGIIFGTLLGAIRENDFISHDEDTDVFILDEDRETFLMLLFKLREKGFEVARYESDLLSLIRDQEYIDIYFFRKCIFRRKCLNYSYPARWFAAFTKVNFLGTYFNSVKKHELFLKNVYGTNWKIPEKYFHAPANTMIIKIKSLLPKWLKEKIKRFIGRV